MEEANGIVYISRVIWRRPWWSRAHFSQLETSASTRLEGVAHREEEVQQRKEVPRDPDGKEQLRQEVEPELG